jgi:type II restriction enzyme
MAEKHRLRLNRAGTIINLTSKVQESNLGHALKETMVDLAENFDLKLHHRKSWRLQGIVDALRVDFPDVDFYDPTPKTYMSPDGGILSIQTDDGIFHPILISEVKNQGTNDLRLAEGKSKQAKGNAIERLGKNVIGLRTAMLNEAIVPFVCFGYGVDFEEGSSILDRVATIAMFGRLNEVNVLNLGEGGRFNRGSFFFREARWEVAEMAEVMTEIATRSIHYYFAKYGANAFVKDDFITEAH